MEVFEKYIDSIFDFFLFVEILGIKNFIVDFYGK